MGGDVWVVMCGWCCVGGDVWVVMCSDGCVVSNTVSLSHCYRDKLQWRHGDLL